MKTLTLFLLLFAAFSNGCMDLLQYHYHISIFARLKKIRQWLNPEVSWKNKYRKTPEGELTMEPAFLGSTTFLVWVTDGWHFFQMLMWTSLQAAVALHFSLSAAYIHYPIAALLFDILLLKIMMGTLETIILKTLKKRP